MKRRPYPVGIRGQGRFKFTFWETGSGNYAVYPVVGANRRFPVAGRRRIAADHDTVQTTAS